MDITRDSIYTLKLDQNDINDLIYVLTEAESLAIMKPRAQHILNNIVEYYIG